MSTVTKKELIERIAEQQCINVRLSDAVAVAHSEHYSVSQCEQLHDGIAKPLTIADDECIAVIKRIP